MLDKIFEYMTNFGFTVIDGDDGYLSFESKEKTDKQGKAIIETLKNQYGKESIITDLFVYVDHIIIEIKIKSIHD